MNLAELKATLIEWLGEIKQWSPETGQDWNDYIFTGREWLRDYHRTSDEKIEELGVCDDRLHVLLLTESHAYYISARPPDPLRTKKDSGYMGCIAECRKWRPGETWHRGNDLHDGSFSRETFNRIMFDILRYELVARVKFHKPIAETEEIVPSKKAFSVEP